MPSAGRCIREIPDCASSPKAHILTCCLIFGVHYRAVSLVAVGVGHEIELVT